jgi:hypothetical protein
MTAVAWCRCKNVDAKNLTCTGLLSSTIQHLAVSAGWRQIRMTAVEGGDLFVVRIFVRFEIVFVSLMIFCCYIRYERRKPRQFVIDITITLFFP